MKVVFLSPVYPPEMIEYTRGLAEVGAQVYGVGDTPFEALPAKVKPYLYDYLRVPRIMQEDDVMERVSTWLRGTTVDRVLSNWEPLVILAARLRERWGVPGMTVDQVTGFRDKQLMKERVAAAGLRVPKSKRVTTEKETRAAAEEIGYPLILKPIAGAGSADTYKVTTNAELDAALKAMRSIRLLESVIAIELLVMTEAMEYQRPLKSGAAIERAIATIRTVVPKLTADRPPSPDIAAIEGLIRAGKLRG
jgi:hypothetical protein